MKTAGPQDKVYAAGFPALLAELREPREVVDAGLVLGLYALLRAAGMRITYGEADVLSGQAPQFHYSQSQPECAELSFVPPVDTLFKSLDIVWKEVTPSGSRTAFNVMKRWIDGGRIALARLKEPLLVYGYVETSLDFSLIAARLNHRLQEETISLLDCDKHFWRYPFDEGNLLIQVEEAPASAPELFELSKQAAHRCAAAWHAGELAGCATGGDAYEAFSRDLKDDSVDFTTSRGITWMGSALWTQWTARSSLQHFFIRMAPRFGGDDRAAMSKAAFFYGQCVDAWRKFDKTIGPIWDYSRLGFAVDFPPAYFARWRDHETRILAAKWVDEAAVWEAKAVGELVKLIG